MDIGEYFAKVRRFAEICVQKEIAPEFLIEKPGSDGLEMEQSLAFREDQLTADDEKGLSAYLMIGFFLGASPRRRLASFALCFEIQYEAELHNIRQQCERYTQSQPLFAAAPELFERIRPGAHREMIDAHAVESVGKSEIYRVGQGFSKLTPYLNSGIVNWTRDNYQLAPMYIRLNPHRFYETEPPQILMETCFVPPDPKWLRGFSLRKGMEDCAVYQLLNGPVEDGIAKFWDYHLRHIRRLEVRVTRREHNYLTMMIEELPREDDPNQFMVGRCIHLDTENPAGTPLDKVTLKHLDLALNVYCGSQRQLRLRQTLQDGKSADATFRTHIFRVEEIPFLSLFSYCSMFFRSKVLLNEWISALFGNETTKESLQREN